jgi:hypothetical protein
MDLFTFSKFNIMSVRTLLLFVQFMLFNAGAYQVNAQRTAPIAPDYQHHSLASEGMEEEECPEPSNIQIEFLSHGEAIITWDPIPNVSAFHVRVTDANQQVIFDNVVLGNQAHISNLEAGERYEVRICYDCTSGERDICSAMSFTYVIVDDVIVMLGGDPCHCDLDATTDGFCTHSNADFYSYIDPGIYTVKLVDGSEMTFEASSGTVKAIGNCPLYNFKMGNEKHGAWGSVLPYYVVGSSKIRFHGTKFCVSGASVAKVTYCTLNGSRSQVTEYVKETAVSPNPFHDMVTVSWPDNGDDAGLPLHIHVYDARAQLVHEAIYTREATPIVLNLHGLTNGLYWLSISGDDISPTVHRLIKLD